MVENGQDGQDGRPVVTGLSHVAICVADLDGAARLFEQLLGRRPVHREYVPDQRTEVVKFDLGGCALELIAPRDGNVGLEKFLATRGPGLHHLALRVEGLAEGLAALKADGVRLLDGAPRTGAGGQQVAFLHPKAAGGVLVELVEEQT